MTGAGTAEETYQRTDMTDHLVDSHQVASKTVQSLWDLHSGKEAFDWDLFLDANHDLLHALERGEVARGAEF